MSWWKERALQKVEAERQKLESQNRELEAQQRKLQQAREAQLQEKKLQAETAKAQEEALDRAYLQRWITNVLDVDLKTAHVQEAGSDLVVDDVRFGVYNSGTDRRVHIKDNCPDCGSLIRSTDLETSLDVGKQLQKFTPNPFLYNAHKSWGCSLTQSRNREHGPETDHEKSVRRVNERYPGGWGGGMGR